MPGKKGIITAALIVLFVALGIAMTKPPRNLQILPQDISDEKLDSIMKTYNKALGVKCDFCHTPYDQKFPSSLNFASDANHMKTEARKMMRLTIDINKNYFRYDTLERPEYLKVVTCITCHRGDPFPANL